jgi:hypothetical protein
MCQEIMGIVMGARLHPQVSAKILRDRHDQFLGLPGSERIVANAVELQRMISE